MTGSIFGYGIEASELMYFLSGVCSEWHRSYSEQIQDTVVIGVFSVTHEAALPTDHTGAHGSMQAGLQ